MSNRKPYIRWTDDEKILVTAEVARQLYDKGFRSPGELYDTQYTAEFINQCIKAVFGEGSDRVRVLRGAKEWDFIFDHLMDEFAEVERSHEAAPDEVPSSSCSEKPTEVLGTVQITDEVLTALKDRLFPQIMAQVLERIEKDYYLVPIKPAKPAGVEPTVITMEPPKPKKLRVLVYGLLADQQRRVKEAAGFDVDFVFLDSSRKVPNKSIPVCDRYVVVTSFANHSTANHLVKRGAYMANGGVSSVNALVLEFLTEVTEQAAN